MLLSIIYLYNITGSTDLSILLSTNLSPEVQKYVFLAFFASFAVKIPKFPFPKIGKRFLNVPVLPL